MFSIIFVVTPELFIFLSIEVSIKNNFGAFYNHHFWRLIVIARKIKLNLIKEIHVICVDLIHKITKPQNQYTKLYF